MNSFRYLFLVLSLCAFRSASAAVRLPNIVLLVADDLGYGELSCQNPNTDIPTPHIDSIARDGIRFTAGYVTAPYCAASRAGLMTGRYQTRFGFEFNPTGWRNEDPKAGLPPNEPTLADLLRDQKGYTTALIGKWHLGGTARYFPLRRGFDEFFGFLHEGHFFVPPPYPGVTTWLRRRTLPGGGSGRWRSADGRLIFTTHMGNKEPDYDADNPIYRGGQPVPESAYLTDALTREAVSFIERTGGERPFFLYLAYNAVHSPLQGAAAYMEKFSNIKDIQRRIFAAMLANLDDSVGKVLRTLDEKNLTDNTLVFFISDNGGPTRELTSSNAPLRGGKGQVYEGGIRVPFLVKWPGTIPAGQVYRRPVISLDIFATCLSQAGASPARSRPTDGVDLTEYLNGNVSESPHETLYWRLGTRTALRSGDWKLLRDARRNSSAKWQLFDLENDLSEANDLAATEPEKLNAMIQQWQALNDEMIEPAWRP